MRAVHVHHGVRGAEADADAEHCAAASRRGDRPRAAPPATEAELRDLRYALTEGRGLRATGHTASDQVETRPLPPRLERLDARDPRRGGPTASSGRCCRSGGRRRRRTAGRHGLAWRDRLDEPRHEARADPQAAAAAPRGARSARAREPARARGASGRGCRARSRRSLVELLSSREGTRSRRPRRRRAGGTRVRHAAPRGHRRHGGRGASRATSRASSSARAGPATASRAAPVRCRMCSWTPRFRGTSATRGRSSRRRTGDVVAVVGPRGGTGLGGRGAGRREDGVT